MQIYTTKNKNMANNLVSQCIYRHTDRRVDRHTDRRVDKQTCRQTDRVFGTFTMYVLYFLYKKFNSIDNSKRRLFFVTSVTTQFHMYEMKPVLVISATIKFDNTLETLIMASTIFPKEINL